MALAAPSIKRQAQPQPAAAIPEYRPVEEAVGKKRNPINETNAAAIKTWLNNLKPKFLEYLAKKTAVNQRRLIESGQNITQAYQAFMAQERAAAESAYGFSRHLWDYLTLYRGEVVGYYLDEAAWEVIFSALGPIGNMMRAAYFQNISWKMAWMKNVLNPNAIYYYFHALPMRTAFDVLKYPGRAVFAILEAGGAPLLSRAHVPEWHYDRLQGKWTYRVEQKTLFTPLMRAIQASHTLAEAVDKTNGLSYDKNRFASLLEETNHNFVEALKNKDNAGLKQLLKKYDGGILKHSLANTARRLRSTERDPLSFLVSLIVGSVWDFSLGLVLNALRLGAIKALSLVPGVNTLRGQLIKFFTSNRWLQTAQMSRIAGSAFLKGTFSLTTASTAYGGAWLGAQIAKLLGIPALPAQIIGGGLGTITGSIYSTALKLSNAPAAVNWTQTFQDLRFAAESQTVARIYAQELLEQAYIRGGRGLFAKGFGLEPLSFRPGPIMKFASWLNRAWWARFPINGFVWRDILLRVLPPELLAIKILGIPLGGVVNWLPAIDYFWQVKGGLLRTLTKPYWNILGKTYATPYYRAFSLSNYNSFVSKTLRGLQNQWLKFAYGEPAGFLYAEKGWLQWVNKYITNPLSKALRFSKPFLQNFFNPGFFMGFSLVPLLTPTFGGWAYLAGPVIGSAGWLISTRIAAAVLPKGMLSPAAFMSRFNALGWTGYLIGQLSGWLIFGANVPFWYTAAWTVGLPTLVMGLNLSLSMIANTLGVTVNALLQTLLGPAFSAFASGIAVFSVGASIASVLGLTVFFAYTIYAGFWVPLQQVMHAGPESACFSSQTTAAVDETGLAQVCSRFRVKDPGLLTEYGYLEAFIGTANLEVSQLDPQNNITKASRQAPAEPLLNLVFDQGYHSNPHVINYLVPDPVFTSTKYAVKIPDLSSGQPFSVTLTPATELTAFLSTYTSYETGKKTVFELQKLYGDKFYGLRQFSSGYLDLLNDIKTDLAAGNTATQAKMAANLEVLKKIKGRFDNIVSALNSAKDKDSLEAIIDKVNDAYEIAQTEAQAENNPFQDVVTADCPDGDSLCQELKQIYRSYTSFFSGQEGDLLSLKNRVEDSAADLETIKPAVKNAYQEADFALQGLKQQIDGLEESGKTVANLYDNKDFWESWLPILDNLSGAGAEQIEALLLAAFSDFFKKEFFYVPGGTTYELCLEGQYGGPADKPIVFSSGVNMLQTGLMFNPTTLLQFSQPACSAISSVTFTP